MSKSTLISCFFLLFALMSGQVGAVQYFPGGQTFGPGTRITPDSVTVDGVEWGPKEAEYHNKGTWAYGGEPATLEIKMWSGWSETAYCTSINGSCGSYEPAETDTVCLHHRDGSKTCYGAVRAINIRPEK